jgi:uncharacterized membrane protein YgaE (UPF0421/DUF939 family)
VVGAIAASYFEPQAFVFACSVLFLGLICGLLRSDQACYRFGGIALAIVMLVPRAGPAWQIAFHRFAEVSIGIGVALVLTVVWPEREVAPANKTQGAARRNSRGLRPELCSKRQRVYSWF